MPTRQMANIESLSLVPVDNTSTTKPTFGIGKIIKWSEMVT